MCRLKDRQIKLQEGLQSLPQLKERYEKITTFLTTVSTEINELRSKIQPLKQDLRAAISEKERLKESERNKLAQLNSKYNSYKSTDQDIQRLNKEAQNYARLDLKSEISKLEEVIKATNEQIKKLVIHLFLKHF